jgi:hypothetical protein
MATHFLIGASSWDGDEATANILATDLEDSLTEAVPALTISRQREDRLAQGFGAALAVVLSRCWPVPAEVRPEWAHGRSSP